VLGEVGVVVEADRADGQAARAVTEGADDAKEALPEANMSRELIIADFPARSAATNCSKNCKMVENPNSWAARAQSRLSKPKWRIASVGHECRQREHDSPMHTCSVIG